MRDEPNALGLLTALAVLLFCLYAAIAWTTFQWRNPKANTMTFWRHLPSVLSFEKMEQYQ